MSGSAQASITITGNLTDHPELRYTPSGVAVTSFCVAVNKRSQKDGVWEERPLGFFWCTAWRNMAENVADLPKGARVMVEGIPQLDDKGLKIEAREVGASVRFATVDITKNKVKSHA